MKRERNKLIYKTYSTKKCKPQSEYECFYMSCYNCIYYLEEKVECGHPDLEDYPEEMKKL